MFSNIPKVRMTARTFVLMLLLILCTGCGDSSSRSAQTNVLYPAAKGSETPTVTEILYPQKPDGSFDIPGLLHIAPVGLDSCRHTVLATDRLTGYDSGEIQQMANYFTSLKSPPLPRTLTFAQGTFVGSVPSWGYGWKDCQGTLQFTNIGQGPIQIIQVGMKLTTDSRLNKSHYRLINFCLFLRNSGQSCPGQGGGTAPGDYVYSLGPAHKATVFRDADPEVEQPVLQPGDTFVAVLSFIPKDPSGYLMYSLMPELVLDTPSGVRQVFDLAQLTTDIAFAGLDQFSCYQLQGDTFEPITPSRTPAGDAQGITALCS